MTIYNITIQVSWRVHEEWRTWLAREFLPDMLHTGIFTHYQLVCLPELDESEGPSYAIQLYVSPQHTIAEYRAKHLDGLLQKEKKTWGDSVYSFATVMEVIN
jgi:Domain of unknown function (DUF4286)